eukprot:3761075-Pyramimonas_sp.AAC.1
MKQRFGLEPFGGKKHGDPGDHQNRLHGVLRRSDRAVMGAEAWRGERAGLLIGCRSFTITSSDAGSTSLASTNF